MKIKLSEVSPAGQELRLSMDESWMSRQLAGVASEEKTGSGQAILSVHLVGTTVNVSGRLSAQYHVPCSRCLNPAPVSVDSDVHMVFALKPSGYELPEEVELTTDDLDFAYYEGDEIDLEPVLREQLILEVPIAPLCSEDCTPEWSGDQTGGPGEDKKVDPRWAPLLKLKEDKKS